MHKAAKSGGARSAERSQEVLSQSQQQLRALFDLAPYAYVLVDAKGTLLDGNRTAEAISGYRREELIGKNLLRLRLVPALQLPKVALSLAKNALAPSTAPEEFTLVRKDGRQVPVELLTYPVNIAGRPCILGMVQDISVRKEAEDLLRASEERYRALVETTGTGFVIIDLQGRVQDANPEYVRLTGHKRLSAISGRSVVEWTAPHHAERNARAVKQCARDGLIRHLEIDYVDRRGRITPVEINATVVNTGGAARILTLVRDITARRRAEDALRESEERIRMVANSLTGSMVYQICRRPDGTRKFTYLSDTVKALYGCTPQQAAEDPGRVYGRLHPGDRARLLKEEEEANRTLSVFRTEARIVAPSGAVRWSSFVSNPRTLPDGSTLWSGIEVDITERKRAEEQILAYQEQLRALAAQVSSAEERERRRLAADLHDQIGQALAVAKMKLGRAGRQADSPPLAALMNELRALVDRMIRDTRSLAFQLSPPLLHELGFSEAVEWLVEQFRADHALTIALRKEGPPLPPDSDLAGMLFRGVRELLMNVVKHARASQAEVIIGRKGMQVRVEVVDDGAGFVPSESSAPAGNQSGFGLFSLRERLSHLGGRLEVRSAPGKGTRVSMIAPVRDGQPVKGGR